MGRHPIYHTAEEKKAAARGNRQRYHVRTQATKQRLKCLVRLNDSQTTLAEPPQIQQARALLLQARALLEQIEPSSTNALLRLVAASDR